jgi:integrase
MAGKPLTVRGIEALKPGETRVEVSDGAAGGLFLVVQPSGLKSWAFRYRSPVDGRARKLTIGSYPAFGLADARDEAAEAARSVKRGVDPADARKAVKAKAADTSDLVDRLLDDFITRHVDAKLRPSSATEAKRLIGTIVRPAWGARKIQSLTRRDVVALLDEIVDRGAPVTANRVLALVRKFGNWCVERSIVDVSPVAGVKAPSEEVSRDRILSDEEIRWLWMATEPAGPFNAVVRLLLLTGQRRSEVSGLTDGELELGDAPIWSIPATRTKNSRAHTVPLSSIAREVLATVPRIDGSGLLFTTDGRVPISGWSKGKAALDRRMLEVAQEDAQERGIDPANIQLTDWRLHDLRRTAASGMARLGHPIHVVEAVLNHKSGVLSGVAAIYNRHDYLEEKRRALESWALSVDYVVRGETPSNVVRLRGEHFGQGR